MTTYAVLEHPQLGKIAVKQGFSWPAFFFTWIWALSKGLVGVGFGLLILVLVLNFGGRILVYFLGIPGVFLDALIVLVFCGSIGGGGNGWVVEKLIGQGYVLLGEAEANSKKDAACGEIKTTAIQEPTGTMQDTESYRNLETVINDYQSRPDVPLNLGQKERLLKLAATLRPDVTSEEWLDIARLINNNPRADLSKYKPV